MTDNIDRLKHLASGQFGDVSGPSESELADIELESAEDPYYTPEMTEDFRKKFSSMDPNYTAVRRTREGTRGAGATDFGISRLADKAASEKAEHVTGSQMLGGTTGTVGTTDFDPADFRPAVRGQGSASWDITNEEGTPIKRASRFDVFAPRNPAEAQTRELGKFYLQLAGPTCNHPRCQAIRARGVELLGAAIGTRGMSSRPWEAQTEAIPSVRKIVKQPFFSVSPNPRDPEHLVGRYTPLDEPASNQDFGDFVPHKEAKDAVPVTEYTPMDTAHPRYQELLKAYNREIRSGDAPIFHPTDYLEHHHDPHEDLAPLPWEQ